MRTWVKSFKDARIRGVCGCEKSEYAYAGPEEI